MSSSSPQVKCSYLMLVITLRSVVFFWLVYQLISHIGNDHFNGMVLRAAAVLKTAGGVLTIRILQDAGRPDCHLCAPGREWLRLPILHPMHLYSVVVSKLISSRDPDIVISAALVTYSRHRSTKQIIGTILYSNAKPWLETCTEMWYNR